MNESSKNFGAIKLALIGVLMLGLGACSTTSGLLRSPPEWTAQLRSTQTLCTVAAEEARAKAVKAGISPDRMQWLYGKKPFEQVGHVSLVIDGWIVVDNGGLGRNVWGDTICAGNVCTLDEAQRGLEDSFLESASLAVRDEYGPVEWAERVASASGR